MSISEAALRKLTKGEVIALFLEYQAKFDNTLSDINRELSELCKDFKKIESELFVSKNVNSKLHKRVLALESQCSGNNQYSTRECLEITGAPDSVSNDDLEKTTIKTFDKLDVAIGPSNIEDCHWLKSNWPKKVIIKFGRRKDAKLIRKNKNKLKGMNLCSVGINNPVFINDSLCSYCKILWRKCKKRWSSKYIHRFWVSNGTLRLKLTENGHVHVITHSQDLDELFLENELLRDKQ